MYKSRIKLIGTALIFLVALGQMCVLCSLIATSSRLKDSPPPPKNDVELYRNQGLTADKALAQTPLKVEDDIVVFSDRAMHRCVWQEEELQSYTQAWGKFFTYVRQEMPEIATYVSVIPLRIGFESPFSQDKDYLALVKKEREKLSSFEQSVFRETEGLATPLPLIDALTLHQDEYIFYRTVDTWTSRGAYYGAQEFLQAAGLSTFPINSFEEYAQDLTRGTLASRYDIELDDRSYYYLYDGYNPIIDIQEEPGVHDKRPMISRVHGGTGIFLGGGFVDLCTWEGLADNGRSLLIVDEWGGNVLAPWMVTQFENITHIGIRFFNPEKFSLKEIIQEQGVTDMLVCLDAGGAGTGESVSRINRILAGNEEGAEE